MRTCFKSFGLIAAIALLCASIAIVGCGGSSSGGSTPASGLTVSMKAPPRGSMRGAMRADGTTADCVIARLTVKGDSGLDEYTDVPAEPQSGFYKAFFAGAKEGDAKIEFLRKIGAKEKRMYMKYASIDPTSDPEVEVTAKDTLIAVAAEKKLIDNNRALSIKNITEVSAKIQINETKYKNEIDQIKTNANELIEATASNIESKDDADEVVDKSKLEEIAKDAALPTPAENKDGVLTITNKSGIDLENYCITFRTPDVSGDVLLTFSVKNNESKTVTAEQLKWPDGVDYKALGNDSDGGCTLSYHWDGSYSNVAAAGEENAPNALRMKDGEFIEHVLTSTRPTKELQLTFVKFVNGLLTITNNRANALTNFKIELQQEGSTVGTIMLSLAKGADKKVAPSEVQWKDGFDYQTFNGALSIKDYMAIGGTYLIYLNNKEFGSYVMSDDDVAGNKRRQFFPNVELSLIADGITSPSTSLQFQNNYSEDITNLKIDLCRAAANGTATDESVGTITLTLPRGEAVNVNPSFVEFKADVHYGDFDISGQTGAEELSRRLYFGALSNNKIERSGNFCLLIERDSFGTHVDTPEDGPLVSEVQILKKKEE